jgi:hypothetical protein
LISEISYSTKTQKTSQMSPVGQNLPSFVIENCGARGIDCELGPDIFRSANALDTENTFFKAKLTYYDDNHKWTAGYEMKEWDIYNVFIVAQMVHTHLMEFQVMKVNKLLVSSIIIQEI